jgi:hypothetical protein
MHNSFVQSISPTISLLSESNEGSARQAADKLRRARFLQEERNGQADPAIALLLAEAESALLQMPHPDRAVLESLAELRAEAAREI